MEDLDRLKKMALIIKRLAERGYFNEREKEALRLLGLLDQEVEKHAQQA